MKRLFAAPRRVLAVGVLAAVAVVVAAGFGYAAVAADNQTYSGCPQNGDLTNVAIGSTLRPARHAGHQRHERHERCQRLLGDGSGRGELRRRRLQVHRRQRRHLRLQRRKGRQGRQGRQRHPGRKGRSWGPGWVARRSSMRHGQSRSTRRRDKGGGSAHDRCDHADLRVSVDQSDARRVA